MCENTQKHTLTLVVCALLICSYAAVDSVQALLARGARVIAEDRCGRTALYTACLGSDLPEERRQVRNEGRRVVF